MNTRLKAAIYAAGTNQQRLAPADHSTHGRPSPPRELRTVPQIEFLRRDSRHTPALQDLLLGLMKVPVRSGVQVHDVGELDHLGRVALDL